MSKTIQCKNPKTYNLTRDKEYEAVAENETSFTLFNDKGLRANYAKGLFEEVKPELTDDEIIDSFVIEDGIIKITAKDGENNTLNFNSILSNEACNVSCGIREITGITSLFYGIEDLVADLGIENEERITDFCKKVFIDSIKDFVSENVTAAFCIFSTNDPRDDVGSSRSFEILETLNDYSECTTDWSHNPNSGNDIKAWVINVSNFNR